MKLQCPECKHEFELAAQDVGAARDVNCPSCGGLVIIYGSTVAISHPGAFVGHVEPPQAVPGFRLHEYAVHRPADSLSPDSLPGVFLQPSLCSYQCALDP